MKQKKTEQKKTEKENINTINIWTKIKKVLKKNGIKGKEKLLYKESIGFDLIDKNK